MTDRKIGNLSIENARIIFRNFSGSEKKFNPAGKRNFCVLIDGEMAEKLARDGWNVKTLMPRDEEEAPQNYIQVAVSYTNIPPKIWMITKNNKTLLDEETVGMLDYAEIETVDLIIAPYPWEMNGKSGVKAYVKSMYVTIAQDEFEAKYMADEDEELPFKR